MADWTAPTREGARLALGQACCTGIGRFGGTGMTAAGLQDYQGADSAGLSFVVGPNESLWLAPTPLLHVPGPEPGADLPLLGCWASRPWQLMQHFTHLLILTHDGRLAYHGPRAEGVAHFTSLG